jgi:hypothetical protein
MKQHDIPSDAWPPKLRWSEVPEAAIAFIPLAERYGLGDDGYRDDLVHALDAPEVMELLAYLDAYPPAVDEWLCGPAANISPPSEEYVAFTCLLLAAEYAKAVYEAPNAA